MEEVMEEEMREKMKGGEEVEKMVNCFGSSLL